MYRETSLIFPIAVPEILLVPCGPCSGREVIDDASVHNLAEEGILLFIPLSLSRSMTGNITMSRIDQRLSGNVLTLSWTHSRW